MARMRFFVAGLTSGLSLNARDTVDFATFANRAMSSIEVSWDLLARIIVPRPPDAVLTPWPFKRAGARTRAEGTQRRMIDAECNPLHSDCPGLYIASR